MARTIALLILLQLTLMYPIEGKRVIPRCDLAREMDQLGVARSNLAKWMFAVHKGSDYQTYVLSEADEDGYRKYGLFQLDGKLWCQQSNGNESKNICNVDCSELLSDNIEKSVHCAEKALKMSGWKLWSEYLIDFDISGETSIEECFEEIADRPNVNGSAAEAASSSNAQLHCNIANSIAMAYKQTL